jgi:CelD/BcsL family acetyltransferase involved in cellulose biosynthesis
MTDPAELYALRTDWADLFQRANGRDVSQSFEWKWCAWKTTAHAAGARLFCLAIRQHGRLILVWPFTLLRHHGLWRVAKPLGTCLDYADVLIDAHARPDLLAYAWRCIRGEIGTDLILIDRVRSDSALRTMLFCERARLVAAQPVTYVCWDSYNDWESYWRSRTESLRKNVRRQIGQLRACGSLQFNVLEPGPALHEIVDWVFLHKKAWLALKSKGVAPWMRTAAHANFLRSAIGGVARFGNLIGFSLTLDGQPIAAQINVLSAQSMACMHATYDHAFARSSPGRVLQKFVLNWAFERRLLFDYMFGSEAYKFAFANRACDVVTLGYPQTAWGRAHDFLMTLYENLHGETPSSTTGGLAAHG